MSLLQSRNACCLTMALLLGFPLLPRAIGDDAVLRATVHRPDGTPAADADVAVGTPSQPVTIENGRIRAGDGGKPEVVKTDAHGRFSIRRPADAGHLVVVHDSGGAFVDTPSDGQTVTLQAWAGIDGVVKIGSKPGAGEGVTGMVYPDVQDIKFSFHATAGPDGRFRFDRLPPDYSEVHFGRQIKLPDGGSTLTHAVMILTAPGDRQSIAIGGTGRAVVGRVVAPADVLANVDWASSRFDLHPTGERPQPNIPQQVQALPPQQRQKWLAKWCRTPEGMAFVQSHVAHEHPYPVRIEKDGAWRLDDVPAGTYQLIMKLAQRHDADTSADRFASGTQDIVVPAMPSGRSDDPLQVPPLTLAVKTLVRVAVGSPAPQFAIKTLDGHDLRLADYRGKYVLLDFWATWCGPCVGEIPNVRSAYDAFGQDPRFAIISLSLDEEVGPPADFVRAKELPWVQGFLGKWAATPIPDDYGISGIPSIWLIGPDGKVVAKDLRGTDITDAVRKALQR